MNRSEMIEFIMDYYNEHFKWQKLVKGEEIDRAKIEALSNEQLEAFIKDNCR